MKRKKIIKLDALKKMARNGNSRAQWLLNNNGIPY